MGFRPATPVRPGAIRILCEASGCQRAVGGESFLQKFLLAEVSLLSIIASLAMIVDR